MVNRQTKRLETSVYRAGGTDSSQLWELCSSFVDNAGSGRVMKARGTCSADAITGNRLEIENDGRPHERHANIVSWPDSKDERKSIQQKIAARMVLEIRG